MATSRRYRLVARTAVFVSALLAGCGITKPEPGLLDAGSDARIEAGGPAAAPDLRFKWVGSPFALQVHSRTNLGTALGAQVSYAGRVAVTPLELAGEASTFYTLFSTKEVLEPMHVVPRSGLLPRMDAELLATVDERSIVVSLDSSFDQGFPLNGRAEGLYNAVVSGSAGGTRYVPLAREIVTAGELATWTAIHANRGHVVTALAPTTTGLFVSASGREGDDTAYETRVVIAPLGGLVALLEELGANGYVITALGRDGTGVRGAGNFIAVGTRDPARTEPHPIKAVDLPCVVGGPALSSPVVALFEEGYSVVGMIFHGRGACDGAATWLIIGQR